MSEKRLNLVKDYGEIAQSLGIDPSEYSEDAFRRDIGYYAVLEFVENPEKGKDGLMAKFRSVPTFLHRDYTGEPIYPGDHVLCHLIQIGTVFYAMPLTKITPSMLLSVSKDMQDAIVKALWETNKKDYEQKFAEIYKQEIGAEVRKQEKETYEKQISELIEEKEDLERKLTAARFAMERVGEVEIDSGNIVPSEIELSSDHVSETETEKDEGNETLFQQLVSYFEDERPRRRVQAVPRGDEVPTFRFGLERRPAHLGSVKVIRVAPRALFSESFDDGKYFVHVTPNRKQMLIRRHDEGEVFCVNHQLMIQDLERLSAFDIEKELKAEYSAKYEGILVHLDL